MKAERADQSGALAPPSLVPFTAYPGSKIFPTLSPDGLWIAWSQLDREESDLMLLENFR